MRTFKFSDASLKHEAKPAYHQAPFYVCAKWSPAGPESTPQLDIFHGLGVSQTHTTLAGLSGAIHLSYQRPFAKRGKLACYTLLSHPG